MPHVLIGAKKTLTLNRLADLDDEEFAELQAAIDSGDQERINRVAAEYIGDDDLNYDDGLFNVTLEVRK